MYILTSCSVHYGRYYNNKLIRAFNILNTIRRIMNKRGKIADSRQSNRIVVIIIIIINTSGHSTGGFFPVRSFFYLAQAVEKRRRANDIRQPRTITGSREVSDKSDYNTYIRVVIFQINRILLSASLLYHNYSFIGVILFYFFHPVSSALPILRYYNIISTDRERLGFLTRPTDFSQSILFYFLYFSNLRIIYRRCCAILYCITKLYHFQNTVINVVPHSSNDNLRLINYGNYFLSFMTFEGETHIIICKPILIYFRERICLMRSNN